DGNQKEIHLSVAHTVQGHHHHETIITLVNVNDNRSLEIEIQKQKMQIEQSAKMAALGVMSSGLAHEINNPLATISGRVQLMHMVLQKIESQIDSSTYEKLTKSLEVMQKTVLRISKIIKGLRSFARETEGDPFETVSMKDVVESTLSFCESRFSSRGIEVQVNVGAELEFHGRGTEISQVLLNALNNSFDAIENSPEKWIKLVAQKVADKIIIKIQDSGPGIPQALRDKVMIPFFTTKEVGKGTGLGLSLSRGLVETHGGRMYFDFSSSCTELVIELPVIQNPTKAQQVKAS
ncbi:MAG: sensor histidine kinase, partial [Bdellovibrionales bacterium]